MTALRLRPAIDLTKTAFEKPLLNQATNRLFSQEISATGAGRTPEVEFSFLADATKKCGAPGLHDAPNDACASRRGAGLAFAVVDPKPMLKITKRAVGLAVIAER